MTQRREPTGAEKPTPGNSPLRWVWPPLLVVALFLGYKAVQDGGLDPDPELIISVVVFLAVAAAVGAFGRRYEIRRERDSDE
jgi:hypothetical protein